MARARTGMASVGVGLALSALVACRTDTPTPPQEDGATTGVLDVLVQNGGGQAMAGASIETRPASRTAATDSLGRAILADVPVGLYSVWAVVSSVGSGVAVAEVRGDAVTSVTVTVQPGQFPQPAAFIAAPQDSTAVSYIDTLTFVGIVTDLADPPSAMRVQWWSNRDGLLADLAGTADDGTTGLTTDQLSRGWHWIKLQATNTSGFTGADSIRVAIVARPPVATCDTTTVGYAPGELATVTAHVSDHETPAPDLMATWSSDRDGDLGTTTVAADGTTRLETRDLSFGVHAITVTVTDRDTLQARATVALVNALPPPPQGFVASAARGTVSLSWQATAAPRFVRYEIYRRVGDGVPAELIATITDADAMSYTDTQAPLVVAADYDLRVINDLGYVRASAWVTVADPGGLPLVDLPDDAAMDPGGTWLYLRTGSRLSQIDLATLTLVAETTVGAVDGWLTVADTGEGVEVVVPGSDGEVRFYDAKILASHGSLATGRPVRSVAVDTGGLLYTSVHPATADDLPLRVYQRATGSLIDGGGHRASARILRLHGRHEAVEISVGQTPADLDYYRFDGEGHLVDHTTSPETMLDAAVMRVAENGGYLITGARGAIFVGDRSLAYRGDLTATEGAYRDFATVADGSVIYAAAAEAPRIDIYRYPNSAVTGTRTTRCLPAVILRHGDELVVVGTLAQPSGAATAGVEVVPLSGD